MEYCPHCMRPVNGAYCGACGKPTDWQNPGHLLPVGFVLQGASGRTYLIGAVLGQGGFGVTYIGLERETNRRVAVKEYFPTRCSSRRGTVVEPLPNQESTYESGRFSFVKEASVLSSLQGMPAVVQALDYVETNNTAYLVMEFLDGIPLYRIVNERGKIPAAELLPRLKPLLRDIGKLHEKNIIHRDISPDNVMWMADGTLKLMDFGCARSTADNTAMTVALKQGFAPVEQYQSHGQGPYTDVYALSATIYYCLTGMIPPASVERQLGGGYLQSPISLGAAITQEEENALLWGMTIDPNARPANMEVFAQQMFPADFRPRTVNDRTAPSYTGTVNVGSPNYGNPVNTGYASPVNTGYASPVNTGYANPANTGNYGGGNPAPKGRSVKLPVIIGGIAAVAALAIAGILWLNRDSGTVASEPSPSNLPQPSSSFTFVSPTPSISTPSPTPELVSGVTEDGFAYTISDGQATITGYTPGSDRFVSLPETIENCDVTRIAAGAFDASTQIESLYLSDSMSVIEASAFSNCPALRDIYVYSDVDVASLAFTGCSRLRCFVLSQSANLRNTGSLTDSTYQIYRKGMDTGAGALDYVWVTDDGCIYAITEDSDAVLLDVPNGLSNLDIPETVGGDSVSWIYDRALDNCYTLGFVYLRGEVAFSDAIFQRLLQADLDAESGSFAEGWALSYCVANEINELRQASGESAPSIQVSRDLVRLAMVRAGELTQTYASDRPDGEKWSTVLTDLDWHYAGQSIRRQGGSDTEEDAMEKFLEGLLKSYVVRDDGTYYTDIGLATCKGDVLYMACLTIN